MNGVSPALDEKQTRRASTFRALISKTKEKMIIFCKDWKDYGLKTFVNFRAKSPPSKTVTLALHTGASEGLISLASARLPPASLVESQ